MNNRRKLVIALGVGAIVAPRISFSQSQGKIWRIGFFSAGTAPSIASRVESFRAGLRDLGYVEGKNIAIEFRWAEGNYERLPTLAAELARLKVDVIVTVGTPPSLAAQKATTTIPIVMVNVGDPVASGLISTLARPGGNITGLTSIQSELGVKHLEMLLSMVPKLSRVAMLVNSSNPLNAIIVKNVQAAAAKTGIKVVLVEAQTAQEIEKAFSMIVQQNAQAVIVSTDPFFNQQSRQIAELSAKNRLSSIFSNEEFVENGGLMSYGSNSAGDARRAASYVDKILKGARPGELPVEQPTHFQLLINRKTAKALGLTIPQSLLISADRVIE